jgi:hypothetical protein
VDGNGDVVAAGTLLTGIDEEFAVIKFNGTTGAERWRQVIPARPDGVGGGTAEAVAVDGVGDVVAAGVLRPRADQDFTVLKFDGATGTERWRQRIPAGFSGGARAVGIDPAGDVVAAGRLETSFPATAVFAVVKFAGASGTEQWRQTIVGPANNLVGARAVGIDPAGDVVAAGVTQIVDNLSDFTVLKVDGATGAERWRQIITGTTHFFHEANAVGVDTVGAVVAVGRIQNVGTSWDFTAVKVDGGSGAEQWRQVLTGTGERPGGENTAQAVAVDRAGDVVAAGGTENTAGQIQDFTVVKVDGGDGAEQWRQVLDGTPHLFARAEAVAVDRAGDVVAAGRTQTVDSNATFHFTVAKLAGASGTVQWRQDLPSFGLALAVAVDGNSDVVAAGSTGAGFTVLKFDGATGTERWRQELPGSATAVAVDGTGDVVAAGMLTTGPRPFDRAFAVLKFEGATGTEQWRQVLPSMSRSVGARAVTVDGVGDVVAAGVLSSTSIPSSVENFAVVKLDGASGAERWRQVLPDGRVSAVAVDASGNVVAAGDTRPTGSQLELTIVKFRGTDGGDFEASACVGTGVARLRGRVRVADPPGNADVALRLRGPGDCRDRTTTNAQGHYVFRTLGPGTYTVTPAKDACTFTPVDRTVTIAAQDVRARFRGTCP